MAFSVVLHPAFLLAVLSLRASRSEVLEEPLPLTPEIHKVSFQLKLQEVNLEWTVPALTHEELNMIFQIEISRLNISNTIWVENYSTTVKREEAVRWNWTSDIPLECVKHFIRIRALVDDTKSLPQSSWGNWSSWKEVNAKVSVEPDKSLIFPKDKVLEEGSNVTICLMYGQNVYNVSCKLQDEPIHGEQLDSHVSLLKLNNVVFLSDTGTNINCQATKGPKRIFGTVLFVSKVLEEPKNVSCETRDFKTLDCSWEPGVDTTLTWRKQRFQNYTLCESFSKRCEVSNYRNSYTWQITEGSQEMYNFTLTAENQLRKRSVNINFNLTHRVHPKAPQDVTLKIIGATKANMTWKVHSHGNNYTLLCQVKLQYGEVIHEHNVSVHMSANYLFSDLDPDTKYKAFVRCASANHFWKWSDWTQKEFSTPETAPSQALDVWRQVWSENGRRIVTLFWKPLLKSQANGKIISYNIVVENEAKPTESEHYCVWAPALSTNLSLDLQPYKIRITTNNSMGASPESLMVLSNDSGHEEVKEKTIKGIKDAFNISWEPVSGDTMGYVVDWCAHSQDQRCDLQWKNLGPNTTSTTITSDDFKPGVRYNFRIFERSVEHKARLVEKQRGYTQELAPLVNPKVEIPYSTPNSFVLRWPDYDSDFQAGFIKGYLVYVKSKEMQCNQPWERTLLPDNSVLCKYDINGSETKTLTVENLQPESLYEFFVTPYTSAGPGPNETFTKVTTPDARSHMLLQIILPMTLCVLLSIIVCYWKSQWVKEKCYPDIPNPYKSSILSLIKSKKNPHLIMNVKDCIPDVLEVINKAEGSKTQCVGSGKLHIEDVPTKPPIVPTEKDSSGPVPCIFFENFTYDQSAFDSGSHGLIPGPLKDTAHQLGLLAPPNKFQNVLKNDYMKPLVESPTEETSLIYVSQLASPMCGDKDTLATEPPVPVHGSEYKRQMVVPGSLASPSLKEDNSLTSTVLLGQGEQ
uniref:Oncostatin-M-specific receptor subunit beta n=2 Tax=Mus musculus TaxID=10090 RepID=OSMR_MOUSE|nr:RecName: Full=Oncostatin-M-specific receptor subunit beta; AltName: Full=Interleukin-31 receptor subunit beta; Short=IL-31 receptor subunit beta; Short=IL-31R subunit beta; Short=IL-31R-beta; Short=IL-31RB; Flags: Precursor [Mus musculus]AAC40122.1 oncostatin M specific receptor [Mus musculus]